MNQITLTEKQKEDLLADFKEKLENYRMTDGKITYLAEVKKPDKTEKRTITVMLTPIAYVKMMSLVHTFTTEVAWYGLSRKLGHEEYQIYDILVYPQIVSGATVNTDQEPHDKWMISLTDEQLADLRFQGHSHVNMDVKPSSVDMKHQSDILRTLSNESFFIFMIVNKRHEIWCKVYDMVENKMYDNTDIRIIVADEVFDEDVFTAQAEKMLTEKTYSYNYSYQGGQKKEEIGKGYAFGGKKDKYDTPRGYLYGFPEDTDEYYD